MENKHASLALVIVFSLAAYSYIKYSECKALKVALEQSNAGFAEFAQKSINGHKLYEYINPNTVGTFRIAEQSFACAQLNTPLPVLHPKK